MSSVQGGNNHFLGTHRITEGQKTQGIDAKGKSVRTNFGRRVSMGENGKSSKVSDTFYTNISLGNHAKTNATEARSFSTDNQLRQKAAATRQKIKGFVQGVFRQGVEKLKHAKEQFRIKQQSVKSGKKAFQASTDIAIENLKKASTEEEIQQEINTIRNVALKKCPKNASDAIKQDAVAQAFASALEKLSPISDYPLANQKLSFALGQLILIPTTTKENITKAIDTINGWVEKDRQPENCGKDLFRSIPRIDLIGKNGSKVVDHSDLEHIEEQDRDTETGEQMIKLLNILQHEISGENDDLITQKDFESIGKDFSVNSQVKAGNFGKKFSSILNNKNINDENKKLLTNFFSIMGIQAIITRPGEWVMPGGPAPDGNPRDVENNYRMRKGNLSVSELSKAHIDKMKPMEYERTLSFTVKEDGSFELEIQQPITFKNYMTEPLGTCRVKSTFTFDSELKATGFSQEIMEAQIIQ